MNIIYARQEIPEKASPSVFLAGPTPREEAVKSWRPEALKIFEDLGFKGTVFVPEPKDGKWSVESSEQIEWEWQAMKKADCILFWVPRELVHMPAFITNIEWGKWYESGKVVLGFPENTPKMGYFKHCAIVFGIPVSDNLAETIKSALKKLK